jgi:hypothetical protein
MGEQSRKIDMVMKGTGVLMRYYQVPADFGALISLRKRLAAAALCFVLCGSTISAAKAEPAVDSDMYDFMVMDVCVDAGDKALPNVAPGSPQCTSHRNIRQSDRIPYHLTSWNQDIKRCPGRFVVNDNIPLTHAGVTRIMKTVRVAYSLCPDMKRDPIPAYYSVRWFDDKYTFIMGAWSRGKNGGTVRGGITPECDANPHSSRRYFHNWMLFGNTSGTLGQTGYTLLEKASHIHGLPSLSAPCPDRYPARVLAVWSKGEYRYRSGQTLETIVSHPYSQADESGTTPGKGRQMERTYWTREFGQTRWENWKRDDYVNKKTGGTASGLAKRTFEMGYCDAPFSMPSQPTPNIKLGNIETDGAYSQVLTDLKTGETHRWYMAGCQDITKVVPPQNADGDDYPDVANMPDRFWEFWQD